ncbi:Hint domain-containing protein [Shimia sp. R9_2]|uniref:Hint domain-containing protein n=1 Tax=Shimia sp. R9_2 TaxID=2821112 RepID=UPI001ADC9BC4|nr:Hint domain-containing protein [Shimia sp. R9_2]MBO9397422.1 Hint domain-containing protein [Shimia sp. R9_2]
MPSFSIVGGNSTTFTDTTPNGGFVIDFVRLDNSLNVQINGVNLFVGGPGGAATELQFQTAATAGQTVRFADGDRYASDTPEIWQLNGTAANPIFRLQVDPDGTVTLSGVKSNGGALEPLELFNGLSVNSAAVAAAWNDSGSNTIVVDQIVTGPTNASGEFVDVPCFTTGTLIDTLFGPKPIESLQVGDMVLTYDCDYEPIRWIGSRKVTAAQLRAMPKLKPILIRANALGLGYPKQDLQVSPQHRLLVSSKVAMRMFGSKDVLIPAQKLLPMDGIEVVGDTTEGLEYWHILFDSHQVVWSNGAPSESLYTGPQALKALSPEGRAEIQSLFPEICQPDFKPISARHIPEKGKQVKKMIERHQANNKPLYCHF